MRETRCDSRSSNRNVGSGAVATSRNRAGQSSVPVVVADTPKVAWALDFQFDSTVDGKKVKIASMVDEHTCMSLLDIVEGSIAAERLIEELEKTFAIWGGPPTALRVDNGPEFISEALRKFCAGSVGISYIPPGTPWKAGSSSRSMDGERLGDISNLHLDLANYQAIRSLAKPLDPAHHRLLRLPSLQCAVAGSTSGDRH